jgi:archaellum component FlaF (FlaF/FlaG flagellin family)
MRGLVYVRRLAVAIGAVTLVALALAIPAFATTGSYAATSSSTVRAGTTEASLSTPTDLKVTLTNTSSSSTSYKLGSANVTFPGCSTPPCAGGFALQQGTVAVTATGGNNWSAKVVGNVVQLRTPETSSNYLVPGKSVTVTVKAVAAPTKTGVYALSTIAKDDGDYDNSALASTGAASITVKPGPLNSFAWTKQPASPRTAGASFPVGVTAYDVYGNVKTDYAGAAALSGLAASPGFPADVPPGAAAGTAPSYGTLSWSAGVGSATVTAFKAQLVASLSIQDGVSTSSASFTVNPGPLSRFKVDPGSSSKVAGSPFGVAVTAYDAWGNVKTDYAGAAALSGLAASPGFPADVPPGAAAGTAPSYGTVSWSAGVGSATVTAFKADPGTSVSSLSLTDTTASVSATSASFAVSPGALSRFKVDPGSSPKIAGSSFGVTSTAYDAWGNTKTDYTGTTTAVLSGSLGTSPGFPTDVPAVPGTVPSYGLLTWLGGVGSATVAAYNAEFGVSLSVSDGSVSAASPSFTVGPGPFGLKFTKQPGAAKRNTNIPSTTPPDLITVRVADAYGNLAPDATGVTMIAPQVPPGGPLSSGGSSHTTSAGLATFGDLQINTNGIYTLRASLDSSPTVTATSDQFVIADNVCTGVSVCTATASNGNQTSSAKITTADPGLFQSIVLATTFLAPAQSNCSGFTLVPGTDLTDVSILNGNVTAAKPTFLVTLIIPKATLQTAGYTSRSANSFDVCVGAKWIAPEPPSATPWKTKAGANSTLTDDGFYWGLAPDCSTAGLSPENPCALLKTKNANQLLGVIGSLPPGVSFSNSDIALVVRMAYPWDGRYGGG